MAQSTSGPVRAIPVRTVPAHTSPQARGFLRLPCTVAALVILYASHPGVLAGEVAPAPILTNALAAPGPATATLQTAAAPDTLYWIGREALNRGEYHEAAATLALFRREEPQSEHVRDAVYYEALARYRTEDETHMQTALRLLERYPSTTSSTQGTNGSASAGADAEDLRRRIGEALARTGPECPEEEAAVRSAALRALQPDDPGEALALYREILFSDDPCHRPLRSEVLSRIVQVGTVESVEVVRAVAYDESMEGSLREHAVLSLRQSGLPEAVELLGDLLEPDGPTSLQDAAVRALGLNPLPEARALLRDVAASENLPSSVRSRAASSLARGPGTTRAVRFGEGGREVVTYAEGSVTAVGSWNAGFSVRRPNTPDPEPQDLQFLLDLYRTTDDAELRESIFASLGASAPFEFIVEVARAEPERRAAALRYLGQMDDPRAEEFLRDVLQSGFPR